jgi:hypothetical protein
LDLLFAALKSVLRALEGVHNLGCVQNILRVIDETWVLIDFENAAKATDNLIQEDIRMIGRLID